MAKRRVVITGLGAVTPLGNQVEEFWQAIIAGKSGVGPVTRFDVTEFSTRIAAEVKNFDPSLAIAAKQTRKLDTFVQFAAEASRQALLDSGIEIDKDIPASRAGVAIGSGIGGIGWIERNHASYSKGGPRKISPFFIPGAIINMSPGIVSIYNGFKGPNISIVTACTTGAHNIASAARMIERNEADIMLAGGTEMATCPLGIGGFASMKALSRRNDEPERASRPWDQDRDGFVLGEGAGVLLLEDYDSAKQRGAHIYAELAGFGMSADAYHMTAPDPDGIGFIAAMHNTLKDANLSTDDIDYINAHGTSTPVGDIIEANAIAKVLGNRAQHVPISSTKSMTGHTLGAAGAIEAIISILAIRDNIAPPTINLDNPFAGCELNLVPHTAQQHSIDVVLSNSFGFGGTNGSLVFKRI